MLKVNKTCFLVLFSIFIVYITVSLCYFIAEKYFFDKFFYQKSLTHGYLLRKNNKIDYKLYGKRSQDYINFIKNYPLLDTFDKQKFTIVIIGDSVTWGQGLKNNQRFISLLEQKLNEIKPSKVISIAYPGWNILNHLYAYQQIKEKISPNLIIFSLVLNDINIYEADRSYPIVLECQNLYPQQIAISEENQNTSKTPSLIDPWINSTNLCVLDKVIQQLPTKDAFYFISDSYNSQPGSEIYMQYLLKNSKNTGSSRLGENLPNYKKYWLDNPWLYFTISKTERHPNALANQMYADILFNEITTNPIWESIK